MTYHPPIPVLPPSLTSTVTEILFHSSPATFVVAASAINLPAPPPSSNNKDLRDLSTSLYYVNEDDGTFGLITVSHTADLDSRTRCVPLCTNLIRPTRVVLSGDVALRALYDHPPPSDLLPATDEAGKAINDSIEKSYER